MVHFLEICQFGSQSKLTSAGFSPGTSVFLLHLNRTSLVIVCFCLFRGESSACTLSKANPFKDV